MLILKGGEIGAQERRTQQIDGEELVLAGENVRVANPTGQAICGPAVHDEFDAARIILADVLEIERGKQRTAAAAGSLALVLPIKKDRSNPRTFSDTVLHPSAEMVCGLQDLFRRQTYRTNCESREGREG